MGDQREGHDSEKLSFASSAAGQCQRNHFQDRINLMLGDKNDACRAIHPQDQAMVFQVHRLKIVVQSIVVKEYC